jgi:nitroreductase
MRFRRSIREYNPRPVEEWKLKLMLEAARLAPSSTNSQPWRIIVVQDPQLKAILADATPGKIHAHPWLVNAPVIFVLCAEKSKTQRYFGQLIGKDYHLVDMGIVGEHLCLVAAELGLGTCWLGWIYKKQIKKAFNIPLSWEVVSLISVGYPSTTLDAQPPQIETAEPRQKAGERGIGGVLSRERYPPEKLFFYDKLKR